MVFRSSGFAVYDVTFTFDFAGEYVIVDITDSCDISGSENDGRFYLLALFGPKYFVVWLEICCIFAP